MSKKEMFASFIVFIMLSGYLIAALELIIFMGIAASNLSIWAFIPIMVMTMLAVIFPIMLAVIWANSP